MGLCNKSKSEKITNPDNDGEGKVELKKQITLLQGVAIIVGVIIGSGIFVSPVGILSRVKSVGLSFVLWVTCGIYNMLCALCYAELGTTMPQSGGEYIYIKEAFGDILGFIGLWINFVLICPVGIAASNLIFSTYLLKPFFPDCEVPEAALQLLAALLICLLIGINCVNVTWATKMSVIITASKLIALAIIIVIGFIYIGKGETEHLQNTFEDSEYDAGDIAIAFYSGFWAYSGWSYLNFLLDEMVNPHRDLPRAILISMTLVIVVYLIANVAYLGVLSPAHMLESPAVAVTFGDRTMGVMAWLMPILIAISVSGTVNGIALGMSRLFYIGAQNGQLPSVLSMINYKHYSPQPSLIIILLMSLAYQFSGDIFFLIEMEGFGFATNLTFVFAGQVYLRYKKPDLPRSIKVPVFLPALLCLVSFAIVALTFYQKPHESVLALIIVMCGLVTYLLCCKWDGKPQFIENNMITVTTFIQKMMLVVQADDSEVKWD
ncbi:hypothetical protein ScPMuIL_009833 [Solemya velum]